ncbi:MAG: helix-turn-helix transcriptional regulator [Clostridia bacterium]|nr:helix-turn-helix transcriptional regulator [Clostridia bacterium]
MMNLSIGNVIRRLRVEKCITQEELANVLGVGFQAVSKWETGSGCPDRHTSAYFQPVF